MAMRNFLRFPLSTTDQAAIVSSLKISEVPPAVKPPAGQPFPQSLQLDFSLPSSIPQIRALFPGSMTFLASSGAQGSLPDWKAVSRSDYAQYKTVGTLLVTLVADRKLWPDFLSHTIALPVQPNRVWYSPVRITEEFLFDTLPRLPGVLTYNGHPVPASTDRTKHAVAAFLRGDFHPELRLGATAGDDAVAKFSMPVVYASAGQATLLITMAAGWRPQDASDSNFDTLTRELVSTQTERTSPRHLRNGSLPARWVLKGLQPNLIDGNGSVATAVAGGATPVRYVPLRFTRAWTYAVDSAAYPPRRNVRTCSTHLPTQTMQVKDVSGVVIHEQRLPAHGLVLLEEPPSKITVTLAGGSPYLAGGPNAWHTEAGVAPLSFDLAQNPEPHIIVRRTIPQEMLADTTRPEALPEAEDTCTYWSLRRTVRGLVDHYLTGGRLNWEAQSKVRRGRATGKSSADVIDLLKTAWGGNPDERLVTHGGPSLTVKSKADVRAEAGKLKSILQALFPGPAPWDPSVPASGSKMTQGEVFYNLWQSIVEEFAAASTRGFYPDHVIGRGSGGAAIRQGLATSAFDPTRFPGEAPAVYADRMVGQLLGGLRPGDLLQFWTNVTDFESLRARQSPHGSGHSLIFLHYLIFSGEVRGIVVIDDNGDDGSGGTKCPLVVDDSGRRSLEWNDDVREAWIAARWN
ncbi:hypothetical protein OF117_11455 [Geodermatophilus sp. YIM 151500]|uniref:hypothetical protein n=1 Tax=Geodermatophilus sp. YIM 151500 TaxID=2984531 RepID=UPI0021E3C5E9|nr:hypothetical protein [Geodermatophilus sp. YIM 151500]MCV2489976.1 hypothetical protein [Geodermatophilus sp. YIM 151500]